MSLASPPYIASKPIQPHVSAAELGPLHDGTFLSQLSDYAVEHRPVVGLVRLEQGRALAAGQGLLQGIPAVIPTALGELSSTTCFDP